MQCGVEYWYRLVMYVCVSVCPLIGAHKRLGALTTSLVPVSDQGVTTMPGEVMNIQGCAHATCLGHPDVARLYRERLEAGHSRPRGAALAIVVLFIIIIERGCRWCSGSHLPSKSSSLASYAGGVL